MPNPYPFIPADWWQHRGAGVTIALFDTGVNLQHPALQHLDQDGSRFDLTRQNFRAAQADGNDDVADLGSAGHPHGTQTAGVIAARPADGDDAPEGLANEARLLICRVRDTAGESWIDYFQRGLELALAQQADIILAPYTPTVREPFNRDLLEHTLAAVRDQRIALVAAAPNTSVPQRLNRLEFPANWPHAITTAVLQPRLLERMSAEAVALSAQIRYAWPEQQGRFCYQKDGLPYKDAPWRSSHAAALVAGLLALRIGLWKTEEGDQYARRPLPELLAGLDGLALPFTADALAGADTLQLFLNQPNT